VSAYPLVLQGSEVSALVVGGGSVATRKARGLAETGARVRVVAPRVSAELRDASRGNPSVSIEERPYESGDVGDALVVVAATDSRDVNARVAADAKALHRLVNVADAPEEGNCSTVATHRAGDLLIAVSAGGVPAAAARVRDCLAERFDGRYAAAVAALGALRSRVLRDRGAAAWRRAAGALAGADFCTTVEDGTFAERVATWP
jgi:precorrin-2 dehydrogenase/sirohydrochlorin ferrochelatase